MTEKNCSTCVFYEPKKGSLTLGTCEYPVPEYLTVSSSGGKYRSNPEYTGIECPTYKSKAEVAVEAIKDHRS